MTSGTEHEGPPSYQEALWAVCLIVFTAVPFARVAFLDFVDLDDPAYVTESELVQRGLDPWALVDALGIYEDNWHPLVWWSLMLDYQVFGLNSAAFHLENLAWHLANVGLLFVALRELTGDRWRSAIVAALFGVHPLHVESVAWVAERKDVLSGFWWMLGLWAYPRWARTRTGGSWWLVTLALVLGLMSKQIVVTLPFVFLLLDYWPLRRLQDPRSGRVSLAQFRRLIVEKLPWFALIVAACLVAMGAQQTAMQARDDWPLSLRVANATLSGVRYLQKTAWPARLGVQYPLDAPESIVPVILAGALLLGITAAALWAARRSPAVLVGWLWYLGVLTPVIGLVQVGTQSMADRYMYLPLIGLGIAVAWAVPTPRSRRAAQCLLGIAMVVLAGLAVRTFQQTAVWKDGPTLFFHALQLDPSNETANFYFGGRELRDGRIPEALHHFHLAVEWDQKRWAARRLYGGNRNPQQYRELNRYWADIYFVMGQAETLRNETAGAIVDFRQALSLDENLHEARLALGMALLDSGQAHAALDEFNELLRRQPSNAEAAAARQRAIEQLAVP